MAHAVRRPVHRVRSMAFTASMKSSTGVLSPRLDETESPLTKLSKGFFISGTRGFCPKSRVATRLVGWTLARALVTRHRWQVPHALTCFFRAARFSVTGPFALRPVSGGADTEAGRRLGGLVRGGVARCCT